MKTLQLADIKRLKKFTEGVLTKWHRSEGDEILPDEPLLEVSAPGETIKVNWKGGGALLKILEPEGAPIAADTPLAAIGKPGEDVSHLQSRAGRTAEESAPAAEKQQPQSPQKAKEMSKKQPGKKEAAKQVGKPSESAGGSPENVTPILMPQLGQTMEEGTIISWRVEVGQSISEGDIIFEVETDKANIEVESPHSGRLARIVADEGETIQVKQPVAYLAENDADVDAYLESQGGAPPAAKKPAVEEKPEPSAPATAEKPAEPATKPAPPSGTRVKASPAARKAARRRGVDISAVAPGSGPGGRVLSTDVEQAEVKPRAAQPTGQKISGMRKAIARNLTVSKQTIPHFYMRVTINAGPLVQVYRETKARFDCTINDFIVAAVTKNLMAFPSFRSRLEDDEITVSPAANVGVATAVENGLVVPVVVGAEGMGFRALAARTKEVVKGAHEGKIAGMGQGVFTVSNAGMFGIEEFAAIINPPESGILAVGAIRGDVLVYEDTMRAGKVMTMTLSADHRIIDGVEAAKFLQSLKKLLESPRQLLGD